MRGLRALGRLAREVREDVAAARDRDPAARGIGTVEIVATYSGVQALLSHRISHTLHSAGVPILPRVIAYGSRMATGIEIHPAAHIGSELFSAHGTGVVIGAPAEIGQRDDRIRGQCAGGDHGRARREGGRELGCDPRRAAALDGGREPRAPGARGRAPPRGAGHRLASPARPGRGRAQGARRPAHPGPAVSSRWP